MFFLARVRRRSPVKTTPRTTGARVKYHRAWRTRRRPITTDGGRDLRSGIQYTPLRTSEVAEIFHRAINTISRARTRRYRIRVTAFFFCFSNSRVRFSCRDDLRVRPAIEYGLRVIRHTMIPADR